MRIAECRLKQKHKAAERHQVVFARGGGFTLVEVLVAIVVLSIGFFAVASMQISAVDVSSSAGRMTEAVNLAQNRLEELMMLEYREDFIDLDLTDDASAAGAPESYVDLNGNGIWDVSEPYTDSNGNGAWDAAHLDAGPPAGYAISWSVIDNTPVASTKVIRVYVTRQDNNRTIVLSCIKSRR